MAAMDDTKPLQIADYLAVLRRRRFLVFALGLPIAAVALTLAIGLPDVYRATALIEIQEARSVGIVPNDHSEKSYAERYVQSLTETVQSDASLRRLQQKLDVYPELRRSPGDAARELRSNVKIEMVTVPVLDPDSGREREVNTAFTVAFEHSDPRTAQQAAAWLADAYLDASRKSRQRGASSAAEFFGAEGERFRTRIAALEEKLAKFKAENFGRLPELTDVNLNVMDRTERDLEANQLQMRTLSQDRIFLVQQLAQARSNDSTGAGRLRQLEDEYARKALTYDENHPDMVSLSRQIESLKRGDGAASGQSLQAQLQAERSVLAQTRQRYSDDHPDVRRIRRRIESLEARIASGESANAPVYGDSAVAVQLQTQIKAIDTQIAGLTAHSTELRGKLGEVERRIEATPQVEREYKTLTRDLDIARQKYDEIINHQMDAEVTEAAIAGGRNDEFRLVQAPVLPGAPAKPARAAIAMIGLVLALLVALGGAVAAETFDQSVRSGRDVRNVLGLAPLAFVPEIQAAHAAQRRTLQAAGFAGLLLFGSAILYFLVGQ